MNAIPMPMPVPIPIIVSAKNEERAIGAAVDALLVARRYAEARSSYIYDLRVVLDDTTDGTAAIVEQRHDERITIARSHGGKVEAQRTGLALGSEGAPPPFAVFCDADVQPSEDALLALSSLLDARPDVHVAMCALRPLPPRRRTPLAAALHTYNLRRGFSSSRSWFSGKLFAIRSWDVPPRAALRDRLASLESDTFYDFDAGIVIDDIYLSRAIVREHGPEAIAETPDGVVLFRAPETRRGMNRYYRRMRRELERLDRMFPETASTHRAHGRRAQDLLVTAPVRERMHHALFSAALTACKAAYVAERAWVQRIRRSPRHSWPPIEETKAW